MSKTVTHLIVGLGLGGAETMLYQLLVHKTDPDTVHKVISLGAGKHYEPLIRDLGIELTVLPLKKRPIYTFFKLKKLLKNTDTLCCWMYHANFIGETAFRKERKKGKKLIWNIRHSDLEKKNNSSITLFINKLCAKKSNRVDVIAYNGDHARRVHEEIGYSSENSMVLDNGCDLGKYRRIPGAFESLRNELGITPEKKIILSVAKDTPIKDLPTFISSVGEICKNEKDVVAVMCGSGVKKDNERLCELWSKAGLTIGKTVFPLGLRQDVEALFSAAELYVLHSAGEAFPNTLIQAMACECLSVTTDVGDARRIIDDDEMVISPGNVEKMTEIIRKALNMSESEKRKKTKRNRDIVSQKFDIKAVVREYEKQF